MARRAEGWSLERDTRTDIYKVRFTHAGRRQKISTGERDPDEAACEAARIYAEVVSGRYRPGAGSQPLGCKPGQLVDELAASWIADEESRLDKTTTDQYQLYICRWQSFFRTMDRIDTVPGEDYWRARLKEVRRKTVMKELSALRTFLAWCELRGFIVKAPLITSPPRRARGTASKRPHKSKAIHLTEDEVAAVIGLLPEWSSIRVGPARKRFIVRDRFIVAYETGLRPETLNQLRAPDDYRRGATTLCLRDEIDKARFGRELPLTARAREALDRICPDLGLIFGKHDYRVFLKAAGGKRAAENVLAATLDPANDDGAAGVSQGSFRPHTGPEAAHQESGRWGRPPRRVMMLLLCERRGSNPHGVTHRNLNPARLPIPPLSRGGRNLDDPTPRVKLTRTRSYRRARRRCHSVRPARVTAPAAARCPSDTAGASRASRPRGRTAWPGTRARRACLPPRTAP
jgi:integrase